MWRKCWKGWEERWRGQGGEGRERGRRGRDIKEYTSGDCNVYIYIFLNLDFLNYDCAVVARVNAEKCRYLILS